MSSEVKESELGLPGWWDWLPIFRYAAWRHLVTNSSLPSAVTEKIYEVLTPAKLTSSEKLSVAKELIAHFEDGLADGVCHKRLLASFGDSEVITKLIQRAKERNRSMFTTFTRMAAIVVVTAVAAVGVMLVSIKLRKATPSINYLTQLSQPIADADDNAKAWPIYRGPWIARRFSDTSQYLYTAHYRADADHETVLLADVQPNGLGWENAIEYLDENAELLAAFRKGAHLPMLGLERISRWSSAIGAS